MLTISRKLSEKLLIGNDIEIMVVEIRPGFDGAEPKVRLGVRAPVGVPVHRQEIHEKIVAQRIAAERTGGGN